MAKLVLFYGEPYQRSKEVEKALKLWQEALTDPELYKFEGNQLEPENLEQLLGGASLFSETKIIRVTQAEELTEDKAFPKIIEKHSFDTEGLILEADSLKKSTSLYKAVNKKGKAKKFSEPTGRNFPNLVTNILTDHDLKISSQAKQWLIQVTDKNLLRVEKEVEKLKLYDGDKPLSLEDVKEVVWAKGKDKMFDFFDALFGKNGKEAINLLEAMLNEGVEESKIFFMLANEVRRLIKIQDLASQGLSNKEIASKAGVYNWLVKKKRGQLSNFTEEELNELIHQLHRQDLRMKQGKTDLEDSLFRIVYQTFPSQG